MRRYSVLLFRQSISSRATLRAGASLRANSGNEARQYAGGALQQSREEMRRKMREEMEKRGKGSNFFADKSLKPVNVDDLRKTLDEAEHIIKTSSTY